MTGLYLSNGLPLLYWGFGDKPWAITWSLDFIKFFSKGQIIFMDIYFTLNTSLIYVSYDTAFPLLPWLHHSWPVLLQDRWSILALLSAIVMLRETKILYLSSVYLWRSEWLLWGAGAGRGEGRGHLHLRTITSTAWLRFHSNFVTKCVKTLLIVTVIHSGLLLVFMPQSPAPSSLWPRHGAHYQRKFIAS